MCFLIDSTISLIIKLIIMTERNTSLTDLNQHLRLFEPLLPDNSTNHRFTKKYQRKMPDISADVLLAIGDQSFSRGQPPVFRRIVQMYEKVGYIIRPDNLKLMVWYVLIVTIFLYYIIEMGLLMAFGQVFWNDQMKYVWWLQLIWIVILLIDIAISPLKAYYADGLLIKDINLILKRYLKLEIYLDILCILVIGIPMLVGNVYSNWIKLLWFVKLYSIDRINDEFQRITQLYIIKNTVFLVCKLVIFSIIYGHFMAIFFYLVSMWIYRTNYYGPNTPNIVWVYNSWAFYQLAFLQWYRMYAYIMYYGIEFVTTIAYGDITPKNPLQCLFTIFAFISQAIFWGYILSEILRLLINVYSFNFDRRYHHYGLNYKLKKENVSEKTFRQVQQHTEEIDKDDQFRNRIIQDQVLQLLPPDPLYGLLLAIHKNSLRLIGFDFVKNLSYKTIGFTESKSIFLEQFMKQIKEERHFAGDIFYKQRQIQLEKPNNHCAYFFTNPTYNKSVVLGVGKIVTMRLQQGEKDYTLIQEEGSFKLHTVDRYFGDVEFLTGRRRDHWAICSKNCLLFAVSREALIKYYHLLTLQERQSINLSTELAYARLCLVCQSSHNYLNCPYVFAITRDIIEEQQQNVSRSVHLRSHDRTRLKSLSSWKAYPQIKDVRMPITHQYTQRLLFNEQNQEHFVELQLQQDLEECADMEEELHQTEVIIDALYRKELQELDLAQEAFNADKAYNFKVYKNQNNIDAIIQRVKETKNLKLLKRNAINFRESNLRRTKKFN